MKKCSNTFEIFKSNICHRVKDNGDINFLIEVLQSNEVEDLFEKKKFPECLYLVAMVDYLSRINNAPLCDKYDEFRKYELEETLYPVSLCLYADLANNMKILEEAYEKAIPEFKSFNIVENEVRDIA